MTETSQLRGAPGRTGMSNTDYARGRAVSALDAYNRDPEGHSLAYWTGYFESALEGIVADLRAGA